MASTPQPSTPGSQATSRGLHSDVLLRVAQPDLYQQNAFRITGLGVDATANVIARQVEKLRMAEKFGGGAVSSRAAFSLIPPPDAEQLRNALRRLQDPESRLVDEFFWFWPLELDRDGDEALSALADGNAARASEIWTAMESQQGVGFVSIHNLAILTHLKVLDLEQSPQDGDLGSKEVAVRADIWQETFRRWKLVMRNEALWSRLTAHIQKQDDPRLTTGTARRIRESLPLTLLLINAQLAVRAAQAGNATEARRQVAVMEQSALEPEFVNEALHRAIEPLRERIKTMWAAAEQDVSADVSRGAEITRRLLEQSRPLLSAVDNLLSAGDPVRDGVHDEVALQALSGLIAYGNKTEDWKTTVELLEQVLSIATSASALARIEDNLGIVRENKKLGTCYFCEERRSAKSAEIEVAVHGNVQRKPAGYNQIETTWNHGSTTVPRCRECETTHQQWDKALKIGYEVMFLSALMFGIAMLWFGDLVSEHFGPLAYLAGFAITLVVPGLLAGAVGAIRREGVKPESARFGYQGLQKRKKDGWRLEDRPPGLEIPSPESAPATAPLLSKWEFLRRLVLAGRNIYVHVWAPTLSALILIPALIGLAEGGVPATSFLVRLGLINRASAVTKLGSALDGPVDSAMKAFAAVRPLLHATDVDPSVSVAALVKALGSSNAVLRAAACDELAAMGNKAASAEAVLEISTHDEDPHVVDAAISALNDVNPQRAIATAMNDLKSTSNLVRKRAVQRLGEIGTAANTAAPALLQAADDRDPNLHNAALLALAQVAPETIIPRLILQLKSPTWLLRQSAAQMLGTMGNFAQPAVPALIIAVGDSDSRVRSSASEALEKVQVSIPSLIARLRDSSWTVRQATAQQLANLGGAAKAAIPALEIATHDPDPDVQRAAREALRKVRLE